MKKPKQLSANTWAVILKRRLIDGVPGRELAREYGISETAIRGRVARSRLPEAQRVANQVLAAEDALAKLPSQSQVFANALIQKLRVISANLADSASSGASTSAMLADMAAKRAAKLRNDDPRLGGAVREIVALQSAANVAAETGVKLIAASKGKEASDDTEAPPMTLEEFYGRMR